MSEKQESKDKSQELANMSFFELYSACYNMLEHGEKKLLHHAVRETTNPKISESTARTYCSNISKIPSRDREWYLKNITANLCFELGKKIVNTKKAIEFLAQKMNSEINKTNTNENL
jgi:hypothetical protein